ncbi:hypothetical protein Hypma_016368 [Hypsizygus marmoreus]|uniref:Origin recognition complex subunit 6 n=1 Tax=Hypsizygus marmoreus TaxID=39966 RepID=A0A369J3E6_HYPMA|nr:hypothetical protein Hypma_016368 [Hypsizygus marmoreus]
MTPNDVLLSNLCQGETLDQARVLLRLTQRKTGAGSGHELGAHTTGLPAICAYLASQRLNNGDVTRKTAQAASCLKTSDFEKAYLVVKAALGSARRSKTDVLQTYEGLVRQYEPTVDHGILLGWMNAAGRALLQSDSKLDHEDPIGGSHIKSAIFFWTYSAATGKNMMQPQEFAEHHDIPPKTLTKLLQKLSGCGASLKIRIQNELKARGARPNSPVKGSTTTTSTPRRSPKKATALRMLPSKDSPAKRKPDVLEQDQYQDEQDEAVPFVAETPTKRRRTDLPSSGPPAKQDYVVSPSKLVFPPVASSSHVALDADTDPREAIPNSPYTLPESSPARSDAMDVDAVAQAGESDEGEDERPMRRRFRPVYLDHKQWYSSDRRLKRVWRLAEGQKASLVEMYGHPFESLRA